MGLVSMWLTQAVGTDFFPTADVGILKLHFRAPIGTRIEETEKIVLQVEDEIRRIIPPDELGTINDMVGVPVFYNLAFVATDNISGMDADVLISLKGEHKPSAHYMLIAQITSPELDAQYRAAAASLENRERLAKRTRDLAAQGFYSQQSLDDAETGVKTQSDQVKEIRTMQNYRTLVAPFDGVVTVRHADPGTLVTNATSNRTSAQPVVTISDVSKLRVTVYVDQVEAPHVKLDTEAEITDAVNPELKAKAR